jgi:hypothetical protein
MYEEFNTNNCVLKSHDKHEELYGLPAKVLASCIGRVCILIGERAVPHEVVGKLLVSKIHHREVGQNAEMR